MILSDQRIRGMTPREVSLHKRRVKITEKRAIGQWRGEGEREREASLSGLMTTPFHLKIGTRKVADAKSPFKIIHGSM
jgi:hypothetical protein